MARELIKINKKNIDSFFDFNDLPKHTVRYNYWLPSAQLLIKEKGRKLRYFTLPGKWAWDIFLFEKFDIVEKDGKGFPYVRFCDNNYQFYTEAKSLLGNTTGIFANFEDVVLKDNRKFWDGFPYDIYNLDFCGTCFPDSQPPFSNTFRAIDKILMKHSESKKSFPFLIFLTLKAKEDETNLDTISDFKENIKENRKNIEFKDLINTIIPDIDILINKRFEDFIFICLPKIISYLAQNYCNVYLNQRIKYYRDAKGYYITKFIFRFDYKKPTLKIINSNYIENVKKTLNLDDIILIENKDFSKNIINSRNEIYNHILSLKG